MLLMMCPSVPRVSHRPAVVQQYKDNPLLLHGSPFSLRVYVIVTSVSPLRAYIHSEGIVQQRYGQQRHFQKVRWPRDN